MRRAKRLVSSSETEVVTEEHDHQTCVYALPRPDVWGQPYDFAAAFSVNEDSGFINGTNGINVNEDSLEPPLKMLKVTEKESLPPPSTLPYSGDPPSPERLESTFGAMSTGERCDNTVVMHKEVTASLCSGALDNRQKPLVSTRRLPRYQVEPSRKVPPVREWDASNELSESFVKGSSVILFSSEDGSSDSTWCSTTDSGEDNELSSTVVRRKRRGSTTKYKERELDRHFAGYESGELVSIAGSSCEEGEEVEVEEAEEEEEEEEDVEEREGMVDAGEDMGALKLGGFGLFGRQCLHRRWQQQRDGSQNAFPDCPMNERKTDNTAGKKLIAGGIPQRIAGILFEMHVGHRSPVPCHHTLLHVQHPTTVQGPCGIIGFGIGEVTISGFFLGRKQLVLLSESQRVVLIPVDQLKCKSAQLDTVPTPRQPKEETEHWGGRVTLIPEKCSATRMVTGGNASEKAVHEDSKLNNDDLLYDDDVEMFGTIDWDWVETVVASWRGRFLSSSFNIILVVQPCYNNGALPTRRFYIKPRGLSGEMEPVAKSCSTSKLPAGILSTFQFSSHAAQR
ncbi:hypothetical protein ERJ75_000751000 [Trypanosoma vivax]|nr:hypothetical protein ERJ75_000751000 [Trypanosoma vivax]